MDFNKRFTDNFVKTQSFIKAAELSTDGWDAKVLEATVLSKPQSFGYIWDCETNFIFMFSADQEEFHKISVSASNESTEVKQLYQDALCEAIRLASIDSKEFGDWKQYLAVAFTNYAGTTRTWEASGRMRDGGHYIVCRYKNKTAGVYTLRPFLIRSSDNRPVAVPQLFEMLADVHSIDKTNHPEWFE